jgi:hypothetical protein
MKDIQLKGGVVRESERTKCEIYTRVMGYHRRVSDANIGKRQEYKDRKEFVESKIGRIIYGAEQTIKNE